MTAYGTRPGDHGMILGSSGATEFEWSLDEVQLRPEPWMKDALCAETDPEAFFPDKGGSTKAAKATCARCEVAERCLAYALDADERFGVWGGRTESERRRMRRKRANSA